MSKANIRNPNKPKLKIQIVNFQERINQFTNEQRFAKIEVKPLRSAKNQHERKKFDFQKQGAQVCHTGRKENKLKKLKQEKVNLIESLQILKESAVSAIAQKQDQIEQLKRKASYFQDDNLEIFQQKLQEQKLLRLQLQQERDELQKQLKRQRQLHVSQLLDKQAIIDKLWTEMDEKLNEIQGLVENDSAKDVKIRLLQQQNHHLFQQLQLTSISTTLKQKSDQASEIIDLDQTMKMNTVFYVASSNDSRCRSYFQNFEHCFERQIDRSFATQKLQEVERAHRHELLSLRASYEKEIARLRQFYSGQLRLPTQSSQGEPAIRPRNTSNCSNGSNYKRNGSKKRIEGLQLNLKEMYSIEETVENQLQNARSNLQNLRNEIRMQNLSECPSAEPRFSIYQDTESQFTTKYFEVPTRFLKNNESSGSITINHDAEIKITTRKTIIQPQSSTQLPRKPEEVATVAAPQQQSKKKSYLFSAGFISGIAITSLLGYFFAKQKL